MSGRFYISVCPACGGDRGFAYPVDVCRVTGALIEGWDPCRFCDARGDIEELPVFRTLQDLEEEDADGAIFR